ncbi:hypothetical protein LJC18_04040 [Lachnospiraceae bacterium OttesenSCG-928-E19]|nr:hypothetical protein [Lachnospiraceae bacterium OttesenSCG-928-E19]
MTVERKFSDKNSAEYKLYVHQQLDWAKSLLEYLTPFYQQIGSLYTFANTNQRTSASEANEAREEAERIESQISEYQNEYERIKKALNLDDEQVLAVPQQQLNERIRELKLLVPSKHELARRRAMAKPVFGILRSLMDAKDLSDYTIMERTDENNAKIIEHENEIANLNAYMALNKFADEYMTNLPLNDKLAREKEIKILNAANDEMLDNKDLIQRFYSEFFPGKYRRR